MINCMNFGDDYITHQRVATSTPKQAIESFHKINKHTLDSLIQYSFSKDTSGSFYHVQKQPWPHTLTVTYLKESGKMGSPSACIAI